MIPVRNDPWLVRLDAVLDLLAEEVVRKIAGKMREHRPLMPPSVVTPPVPPVNSARFGRRILRRREVCAKTALSRSTMYVGMKQGWFPKAIKLTERASGWNEREIDAYLDARDG